MKVTLGIVFMKKWVKPSSLDSLRVLTTKGRTHRQSCKGEIFGGQCVLGCQYVGR